MAGGGPRVGAGRPKKGAKPTPKPVDEARAEAKAAGLTPLEYMLQVMNDASADEQRRDRMAVAAAPYVHGRAAEAAPGKKEQKQAAAEAKASSGSKFAPPVAPKLVVDNR